MKKLVKNYEEKNDIIEEIERSLRLASFKSPAGKNKKPMMRKQIDLPFIVDKIQKPFKL